MTAADRITLDRLEQILQEFYQICEIPHPSAGEQALSSYLRDRLLEKTRHVRRDRSGSLLATLPAKNADPDAPTVMLQAHMDMVVAGDVDPSRARVVPHLENNWLCSDGHTSLGADNGIGVAVILHLLEQEDLVHGPLQILFTVREEQGLKGARSLPVEFFKKARYLINLDGFHADTALTGCKSGLRETLWRRVSRQPVSPDMVAYRLEVKGFKGGHSGEDIGSGHCNAICMLAALLFDLQERCAGIAVSCFHGGTGFNVIPACCTADVVVKKEKAAAFVVALKEAFRLRCGAYRDTDGEGQLDVTYIPCPADCWAHATQRNILMALIGLSDGVVERDGDAVSASCNLGRVYEEGEKFYLEDMLRCDTAQQEQAILAQHAAVASAGGLHRHVGGYHSWHPSGRNLLAETADHVYQEQNDAPLHLKTAQVGVEPAYFQEKAPQLEMICLGADIENAHSVTERANCQSILRLSRLLEGILYSIAKEKSEK